MAKISGKFLRLEIGGIMVTANDVISVETTFTAEKAESSGMADDWQTFLADITKGATLTINGYDAANEEGVIPPDSLRNALYTVYNTDTAEDTFLIMPDGDTAGEEMISGVFVIDNIEGDNTRNEASTLTATCTANNTVSDTVVPS